MDSLTSILTPIHKEGHRWVIIFAAATIVLFLIWNPLGWIGVILTLWCLYFFRDPDRVTPSREGLVISPADGEQVVVVQIAGLVARRIVCDVAEGVDLAAGERFGIIRFGSRLDVYLPVGAIPLVAVGQTSIGGETVLADSISVEPHHV